MDAITITPVNYADATQTEALLGLLDEYARSEFGGGQALSEAVRQDLPGRLAATPHAVSALAWQGGQAVGLLNAFESLSTFKARPLLNIHDIAVTESCRGRGIGTALLRWAEQQALERGCCKLTLEVLEGNRRARQVYRKFGFAGYELDPEHGQALFWEKPLT